MRCTECTFWLYKGQRVLTKDRIKKSLTANYFKGLIIEYLDLALCCQCSQ